jgi:agmatinase
MTKLNLPNSISFANYSFCTDLEHLDADVAILGVPYDMGISYKLAGTRGGPNAIREASQYYARGDAGFYDPEYDDVFLAAPWKIVDCGDVNIIHADIDKSFDNIEAAVRKILERGVIPVVLGGDHSISIPVARALDKQGPLTAVQFDAHLDWSTPTNGQRHSNGTPLRRISEMSHIQGMSQIGLRGLGSSKKEDFDDAKAYGNVLISAREAKRLGVEGVMDKIPQSERYYVTIDIDALDISLATGSGSPSPGGFSFDELSMLLEALTLKGEIVCFDFVEVAPSFDPTSATFRAAAMLILNFMGHILKKKERLNKLEFERGNQHEIIK